LTLEVLTKVHLIPEFKKVDYFLKIENLDEPSYVTTILTGLNTIDSISALYTIETHKIKSKNNLIF
jgi:hypothetical protein